MNRGRGCRAPSLMPRWRRWWCSAQHRAVDFRDFLDQIDGQAQPGLAVHVICDNLSTHKAPVIHRC